MKRVFVIMGILMLILIAAIPVFAIISGPPDLDVYENGGVISDNNLVQVSSSNCVPACGDIASTSFMQWNTDDPGPNLPPTTAQLTLTRANTGSSGDTTFTLYEATDCDTATPVVGADIESFIINISGFSGQQVVFDSTALASYVAGTIGGPGSTACVALRVTSYPGFISTLQFGDSEGTNGSTAPDLQLLTTTAVGVDSFSANNGVSPVVWVGLLLVVVLALGVFVTLRRRDSATG